MISVSNENWSKNEIECTVYCSEYIIECFKKTNNSKLDSDNKIKNITILYPSSNTYWFKEWKEKFVPINNLKPNITENKKFIKKIILGAQGDSLNLKLFRSGNIFNCKGSMVRYFLKKHQYHLETFLKD